jgi:hypothetical protein
MIKIGPRNNLACCWFVGGPIRYWRWVALFLGLLLASLVVLFGSYFLSRK